MAAVAAQAFEPEAALWPSADWRGLRCSPAAEPRGEAMAIMAALFAPTASSAVKQRVARRCRLLFATSLLENNKAAHEACITMQET
jgi:hypothetical protein